MSTRSERKETLTNAFIKLAEESIRKTEKFRIRLATMNNSGEIVRSKDQFSSMMTDGYMTKILEKHGYRVKIATQSCQHACDDGCVCCVNGLCESGTWLTAVDMPYGESENEGEE